MKWDMMCPDCKQEFKPMAMLFNSTPGYSCKCRWGTLSRENFKNLFGISFNKAKRTLLNTTNSTYYASGGAYSGDSKQRRKQRRETLRQLKTAREELEATA